MQAKTTQKSATNPKAIPAARGILKALDSEIGFLKGKSVSKTAYDVLHLDLQTLITSL